MNKKEIGLALGSGGLRGFAHIGVLKALEEKDFSVTHIAGSSAGALMGAAYAYFGKADKVEEVFTSLDWKKVFSLLDLGFKKGLIGGKKISEFIKNMTENASFSNLRIPFSALATDIEKAEPVVLNKGPLAPALKASCAFPLIFEAVEIKRRTLLDGGLSEPVPVGTVREMGAERVMAVSLDHSFYFQKNFAQKSLYWPGVYLEIMEINLIRKSLEKADLVVEPDFDKLTVKKLKKLFAEVARKRIRSGYEAAEKALQR